MCAIETTIGSMKIGDKLAFGAYGVTSDSPSPILWLKATPNSDFIDRRGGLLRFNAGSFIDFWLSNGPAHGMGADLASIVSRSVYQKTQ